MWLSPKWGTLRKVGGEESGKFYALISFPLPSSKGESVHVKDHQQVLSSNVQASSQYPHQGAGTSRQGCGGYIFRAWKPSEEWLLLGKPLRCNKVIFLPWKCKELVCQVVFMENSSSFDSNCGVKGPTFEPLLCTNPFIFLILSVLIYKIKIIVSTS